MTRNAAGTIEAFAERHPDENTSVAYAGYDSADILIDAIGRAIDANGGNLPTRRQVVDQLAKTVNFAGLTGTYTFTAAGDPVSSTFQIERFEAGAWIAVANIPVAGP